MEVPPDDSAEAPVEWVRMMARLADHPGVTLGMDGLSAWIVMGAVPLAAAHPANEGTHLRVRLERIGRRLQEAFRADPEAFALAERGWDRTQDVRSTHAKGGRT